MIFNFFGTYVFSCGKATINNGESVCPLLGDVYVVSFYSIFNWELKRAKKNEKWLMIIGFL